LEGHRRKIPFTKGGIFTRATGPLEGIVAHLTNKCGGNVHECEQVVVTSSPPLRDDPAHAAKNVADFATDSAFRSAARDARQNIPDAPNNWICYDFRQRRVIPGWYSIQSDCTGGTNTANLRSWVVEASMTGNDGEWAEIDRKSNNSDLNAKGAVQTFPVAGKTVCRFVRLVNIGRNHAGNDALCLSAFEIFGSLME
jgi:hypothetical protein